jgi:hypothetical protein
VHDLDAGDRDRVGAIGIAWALMALPVALLIGRGLRLADRRDEAARAPRASDFIPVDVMAALAASTSIGRPGGRSH